MLLGEEDSRIVGSVAISFLRMSVGGKEVKAGMPVHLATDPDYRGRGIFATLQAENESPPIVPAFAGRARALGH